MANRSKEQMRGRSRVGGWRSEAGRREYLTAYAKVMATMSAPDRQVDVPTDFGTVRTYRYAGRENSDRTPVVLLPGWGAGAPMWCTNLPGLVAHRPVHTLDALGDAGLSVQTAPLTSADAQAAWVDQTMAGLGIGRAHVVGHSFGGWTATNHAVHHPGRVATLSLLEPVQTFSSMPWPIVLKSIPTSLPFLPQRWRDAALADIGGTDEIDPTDPMTAMISAGTRHFVSKRAFPRRFTPHQLHELPMPVYVAIGSESAILTNADAAAAVARANLRDGHVKIWPGATHSLPFEHTDEVNTELLSFMAHHDDA